VTAHRRESFGDPLRRICRAARALADTHDDVRVVIPVHPNPAVSDTVHAELGYSPRVQLVDPLSYPDFARTLQRAHIVLTDSGGIQKEAPALGKPVLVMRDVTERIEGIDAGTAKLVGTRASDIVAAARELLADDHAYSEMARAVNPYGDGFASARIVEAILTEEFKRRGAGKSAALTSSLDRMGARSTSAHASDEDASFDDGLIVS